MACISLLLWAGKTGGLGDYGSTIFYVAKKKGNKGEKIKNFKTKTVKRLSLISKCHCFNPLERLEFKKFYCRPTLVTGNTFKCSITSALWNPFWRLCFLTIKLSRVFDYFNILELPFVQKKLWNWDQASFIDSL